MSKYFILLCFLFFTQSLQAQTKISGTTKDNKGKKLANVSITLKNSYDGAVSDADGNFNFTTTEKGNFVVEAKIIGFKTVVQNINIAALPIVVSFVLKEELNELTAVTVTAGSFEAGDKKRAATVLTSLDIVTTASASGDITGALKTLPGAQQVGEQEGLFVRGGAGYETKQFIDGTFVPNPFFASVPDIASRGRFSPFLFKGTVFSTGGYSALYGQALSSALILESIDLPERSSADGSISSVFIGAGTQQLAKNKKSSWGINYGYTNVYPYFLVVKQTPDYFKVPEFHNLEANFRIKTKKNGFLKYYMSYSANGLGLRRANIDSAAFKNAFGLSNYNWYNNLSFKENLGKGWKINAGLSVGFNLDEINNSIQNQNNQIVQSGKSYIDNTSFVLRGSQSTSQAKVYFDKRLAGISAIRFGVEHWYSFAKTNFNGYVNELKDNFTAVFAESDIYVTNNIAAKIGSRLEYSSIINQWNIAPRLSFAYKTGKDAQMSVAFGEFYQKPENTWLLFNRNLQYTKATHYIINYSKSNNFYNFRIEAFYKKYDNLVKSVPFYNNSGSGYAQGIELFWRDKKTVKNLDYWISYSYLDTKRNYINFPTQLQPNFAANHTASFVAKRFVTQWKTGFNITYSYATGRPYYFMQQNGNTVDIKDNGTTIPYSSLGFSLNYLPNLGKPKSKTFIVLVASITNVLNNNLIYGYNYNHDGSYKIPINPPAPQFFFLGCFLSWGVDRSQDVINNNL
jgi:vitamin B12 transporter